MSDLFGFTRSVVRPNYALFTPAGLVKGPLAGWRNVESYVVISPQLGARFSQTLVTLAADGGGAGSASAQELLLFVLEGAVTITIGGQETQLVKGGYGYLPPNAAYTVQPSDGPAQLLLFQRTYLPIAGYETPAPVFGNETDVAGAPFLGDEAAMLKTLLPDTTPFDMAVNIFTFAPGATLPMVETHVMEHGLLMIQGQGIYRLGDDWYPVQAGDVIWMASYCPQWFVATGKTPARYIYYKDVNRDPLGF